MPRHFREVAPLTERPRLRIELIIVLALSFGYSGLRAIISIIDMMTRETPLSQQTAVINRPQSVQQIFDLLYQLLGIAGGLAPVALVMFLLWQHQRPHLGSLGFPTYPPGSRRRLWLRDTGGGFILAAAIGIPGLVFYVFAKWIGINATVIPTALDTYWWTVPILLLQALRAALGEELIVVAYFFDRMKRLGVGTVATIVSSALLRGSYHLYQGFGGFIGNVIMGLVFGWVYQRFGRSTPLIVAHLLLDIVSFVGFPFALAMWPQFFA